MTCSPPTLRIAAANWQPGQPLPYDLAVTFNACGNGDAYAEVQVINTDTNELIWGQTNKANGLGADAFLLYVSQITESLPPGNYNISVKLTTGPGTLAQILARIDFPFTK